jgi:ATP-dependent DNA helicase RecG
VILDGSLQRKEIPEIPIDAIREALINSYCHRDYRSSQNNEITIYSNRVEIYNPGTFPEGLKPQDFIDGIERSIKRNPLLAQLMYYSKDIESFGTGLRRISEACEAANVKVEFQLLKMGFAVVFYRPSENFDAESTKAPNKAPNKAPSKRESRALLENQILAFLSSNPRATQIDIADELGVSRRVVQSAIAGLKEQGLLERQGSKQKGQWIVKRNE